MVDYRKLLGKREERVLPYLGGRRVETPGRSFRLQERTRPGWWRFELKGRFARALEAAEPDFELLSGLPSVRGHFLGGRGSPRLVLGDGEVEALAFLPEDEPPGFAPCRARRWVSGELLFGELEFEGDAEEAARQALEDGRSLAGIKGVPASLRAAFGYARVEGFAQELDLAVEPAEIRARIASLAEAEDAEVRSELERLAEVRRAFLAERERAALVPGEAAWTVERGPVLVAAPDPDASPYPQWEPPPREERRRARRRRRAGRGGEDPLGRAEEALHAAGAQLLRARNLAGGQLEVVYRFRGSRFVSVVEARTLNVLDAGVCLDGADGMVTLESLPSVIREAIDTGQLVITRRAPA